MNKKIFSDKMPNRKCDFCSNGYKNKPGVGYYKLIVSMKTALNINSLHLDFICGDHFDPGCFEPSGKLRAGSLPTFFPRRECLEHDHDYSKDFGQKDEEIGKFPFIYSRVQGIYHIKFTENVLTPVLLKFPIMITEL